MTPAPRPYNLVAELTYRCPLRCPYCSNPLDYARRPDRLDTGTWARVFREAAGLGVVHVGLSGGEPALRPDLEELVAAAAGAGLYTLLVSSGVGLDGDRLAGLVAAGLRSLQLSVQDSDPEASDRVAGSACFDAKRRLALAARQQDLPLVLNVVLHRENLARVRGIIALAREWGALRLELANVQIHGFAARNRAGLLPSRAQLEAAARIVREERRRPGAPEIQFVLPDYWADRPKPCMGGWGRRTLVVTPEGFVLPCHEAQSLPGLEFWSAAERPLAPCWEQAPGMQAFRGEGWMASPCAGCPERSRDFGGCRCQAFRLTGDARRTDPACALAPDREALLRARDEAEATPDAGWTHRGPD